jgi:esterase FrsA
MAAAIRQSIGELGGNFAAASGLSGAVDAAIVLGGPVQASFETGNIQHLMFGMAGIAGNAFGFTAPPSPAQQAAACRPFHRGALLGQHANAPMLVLNGTDDVHVVQADTLVFSSPPGTEVILVRDPGTARPPSCPR